ncbi:MAG: hypothetical protein KatS3mg027_0016 [Bacteroidia bacterium]|nr:MAG: hypothetical protein KatS3mg027_0016 [Bacteroidia bacterium]
MVRRQYGPPAPSRVIRGWGPPGGQAPRDPCWAAFGRRLWSAGTLPAFRGGNAGAVDAASMPFCRGILPRPDLDRSAYPGATRGLASLGPAPPWARLEPPLRGWRPYGPAAPSRVIRGWGPPGGQAPRDPSWAAFGRRLWSAGTVPALRPKQATNHQGASLPFSPRHPAAAGIVDRSAYPGLRGASLRSAPFRPGLD